MSEEKEKWLELLQLKGKALDWEIRALELQSQIMQKRHDELTLELMKITAEIKKIEEAKAKKDGKEPPKK